VDLAGWLVEKARESGLLTLLANGARQYADNLREKQTARQRQSQRDLILSAIQHMDLTRQDAVEILQLAQPSLFTAEEAWHILSVLHVASRNNRAGRRSFNSGSSQSPSVDFRLWSENIIKAQDPQTMPQDRIKAAKSLRSWPYVVESLYRGELKVAQDVGSRSKGFGSEKPSDVARRIVANATTLSTAVVKKHSDAVSRENQRFPDDIRKPMLVSQFHRWLETGSPLPD